MRNRIIHLDLIETIAAALGELNEKVVFVGGAVVGLYTNDLAAEDVKVYLIEQFDAILNDSLKQEAILGQLPYEIQMERFEIIMERIKNIVLDSEC